MSLNNQNSIGSEIESVGYAISPSTTQSETPVPLQLNANDLNNFSKNIAISGNIFPNNGTHKDVNDVSEVNHDDRTIEVSWKNLTYIVTINPLMKLIKKETDDVKIILKGLSGYFRSGQLTAIMGPSGCGKSTLLECISGFRKKGLSGDVRITGNNEINIGLIGQNDQLINQLTVKESLILASRLKNYKREKEDNEALEEVIVDSAENVPIVAAKGISFHASLAVNVIKQLGLEICADTRAGSCSGGQRKRLSIALELISKPNILILDEPTSGLDSSACFQTVSVMQQLTQQYQLKHPIAVVATIHQPSARVFHLFDHVYVISYDGRCIYQGSPQEMLQRLANVGLNCPQFHNPADYIAEVASGEYGSEGIAKLDEQKQRADALIPTLTGPKSTTLALLSEKQSYPLFLHLWILFYRSLLTILRDPMLTSLRLLSHLITAVFIGLLYGDSIGIPGGCPPQVSPLNNLENFAEYREKYEKETITITENMAFIFFTLMFIMFGAMMPTIMTFPLDMQVFRKEKTNGWYSCATYYLAKTFADMPFQFLYPTIFTSITYYMTGQDDSFVRFSGFTAISIAVALIAQSQGLLIGAMFMEDASAAVFLGPISCIPLLLFAGFFVRITTIPWYFRPMTYISYMRYSFEAYISVLYGFNRCPWDPALANSSNAKPEWLEYLTQILAPTQNNDGENQENFVETLLKNLGGQVSSSPDGSDYRSTVMEQFEISERTIYYDIVFLAGFFLFMRIATYVILLWKVNARD